MKYLFLSFFLIGCSKKEPKIQIWGNKSQGWSIEAVNESGELLYRFTDNAADTSQFKQLAKVWLTK